MLVYTINKRAITMKKTLKTLAVASLLSSVISTGAMADNGLMTTLDERQWTPIGDTPMSVSIIWGDRDTGPYAMYLKMPGDGFVVGDHAHTYGYRGITIQGTWEHSFAGETKQLPAGSYVFQPGNAFHSDACVSKEDCILMIQQDGKGDAIFPH